MAASEFDKQLADSWRLASQVLDLNSTAHGLEFQLFSSQASNFPAGLDSPHGKFDRYLNHLGSWVGQADRVNSDMTTFVTQARDSRSSTRHGAGPLFDEFCAPVDKDNISENVLVLSFTELL